VWVLHVDGLRLQMMQVCPSEVWEEGRGGAGRQAAESYAQVLDVLVTLRHTLVVVKASNRQLKPAVDGFHCLVPLAQPRRVVGCSVTVAASRVHPPATVLLIPKLIHAHLGPVPRCHRSYPPLKVRNELWQRWEPVAKPSLVGKKCPVGGVASVPEDASASERHGAQVCVCGGGGVNWLQSSGKTSIGLPRVLTAPCRDGAHVLHATHAGLDMNGHGQPVLGQCLTSGLTVVGQWLAMQWLVSGQW
jgi:hypothetical protein